MVPARPPAWAGVSGGVSGVGGEQFGVLGGVGRMCRESVRLGSASRAIRPMRAACGVLALWGLVD